MQGPPPQLLHDNLTGLYTKLYHTDIQDLPPALISSYISYNLTNLMDKALPHSHTCRPLPQHLNSSYISYNLTDLYTKRNHKITHVGPAPSSTFILGSYRPSIRSSTIETFAESYYFLNSH